jgi:SAM-dependent methyltransferase
MNPGQTAGPGRQDLKRKGEYMYSDFREISAYYDSMYVNDAEYAPEAARVKELLTRHGAPAGADLLVLACGTGGHIPYFRDDYNVSGLDLSEDMLGLARKKFPEVSFHCGNLIDFKLDADFDAMVCLYGSIGFVKTVENLRAAMRRIAAHLRPDGLALITPWSTVEDFQDLIVVGAVDRPDLKIARMEQVSLKEPGIVEVTFHHLLGKGKDVHYNKQSMEIGLFSREEYISAMTDAGLDVVEEYSGADVRGGAFIGKRPAA